MPDAASKPSTQSKSGTAKAPGAGSRKRVRKSEYWTPSELIAILGERYGRAPQQASHAPVFELVLTLLSQHTSDHNSGKSSFVIVSACETASSSAA